MEPTDKHSRAQASSGADFPARRSREQRLFEGLGSANRVLAKPGRGVIDRLWGRVTPPAFGADPRWDDDLQWASMRQEPLRARALLRLMFLVVVGLMAWAYWAEVDEITRSEGRVVPSSQLQIVQSLDGGIVSEILVREGEVVDAGQVLLRVDPTRFVSSLRENQAEFLSLQAKAARLQALTQGEPLQMPEQVLREAPDIAAHERRLYDSSRAELEAQLAIGREQIMQRRQELTDFSSRREIAAIALRSAQQELDVTRPLLASGAVSEVELLRLEREVSQARGARDQAAAQMARVQAAIAEANRRLQEIELTARNQQRAELSETLARLASLTEGSVGLADRVRQAELRAPVRGTVSRLLVNTQGGVVQAGQNIMEIVPLDDALVLEARIAPRDIAFLRPGQEALVKFTAYDFAIYGGLQAELIHLSPDAITDPEGNTFYLARVRTLETSLGEGLPIIAGMTAQVDILTGKKSILDYLLKPVLRATSNALSER